MKKHWERVKTLLSRWVASPEYVYVVVASISVIAFVFITPPFQGPDEEAHYVRAQYVAHGYFIPVDASTTSASLPSSIMKVLYVTFYDDDLRGMSTYKYEHFRTKEALKIPLNANDTYKPLMITYSPVSYLPAIPGIVAANLLNLSPLVSMYIARLSLGFASIALVFFAIRLIPHRKYLFAAVGLIPMLLFQQAVVTADSVSYALLALFIAYVLRLYNTKEIERSQWLKLGALCVAITLAKPLLYLFLPLVLLLVKKQAAFRWIAAIGGVCIAMLLAWTVASSVKTPAYIPEKVDGQQQIGILLDDPKRILRVGWNSYMTNYGDDEVRGILGVFGAADTIYPLWMFTAYAVLLGVLYVVNIDAKQSRRFSKGWKLFAGLLCVGYFVAVNGAIYVGYTPVNFDIVYGVQGRYFLPILIIAAAVIFTGGLGISKKDIPKVTRWFAGAAIVLIALALLITFQRYYLWTP